MNPTLSRPLLPLFLLALSVHISAADREFTLEARMTGYIGATGPIAGERNPALLVTKGDNVKIILINGEPMAHDLCLDAHKVKSAQILKVGEKIEVTFVAAQSDAYYCSLPGHRQVGMEGQLVVGSAGGTGGAADEAVAAHQPMAAMMEKPILPVKPVTDDEIGADPALVPPPIARKEPGTVSYRLTAREVTARIEDGTTFDYWCYDGQVPGPMLRARVGDTVEVTLFNDPTSKMVHSIDFHSTTGPGGGAPMLQVPPGQDKTLRFKALNPGLYVYHCATPHIPTHISRGMYGMILIEPEKGLSKVDREYYVMQGDFYTTHKPRTKCHQEQNDERLFEEQPTYVCMNGRVGSITGARTLAAKTGETVRIYFGVGGPNLTCSFHVIGEIFDQLYREADLISPPAQSVQTTMVPTGGATVIEMKTEVPGTYLLVDHSLTRLDKGNVGLLKVEGEPRPDIISTGK
jgi:nitrite reductase (NO-forming)